MSPETSLALVPRDSGSEVAEVPQPRRHCLYGFIRAPGGAGSHGPWRHDYLGVEALGLNEIGAIAGEPVQGARAQQRWHTRVLGWALETFGDVLPVRPSGSCWETDEILALVSENYGAILAELDRLAGCVQMQVSVEGLPEPEPLGPVANGTQYLRRFLPGEGAVAEAGPAVSDVDRKLAALAVERKVDRRGCRLGVAYLIAAERVTEVRRSFSAGLEAHGHPPIRLSGPWVPYSFAALRLRREHEVSS